MKSEEFEIYKKKNRSPKVIHKPCRAVVFKIKDRLDKVMPDMKKALLNHQCEGKDNASA